MMEKHHYYFIQSPFIYPSISYIYIYPKYQHVFLVLIHFISVATYTKLKIIRDC